jgi:NhaA family Na+:H+ antiporter
MATDIAFALAVLAVMGSKLPVALRAFLLTLAVVDDLGAILVIAVFYSHGFSPLPLLLGIVGMAVWWFLQRRRVEGPLLYIGLALVVWTLVHASGVHPTIAGVALGLLTRVRPDPGEASAPVDRFEHAVRPVSAAVCVPLFAFLSAGVTFVGLSGSAIGRPIVVAVMVGLVVGKPLGILGGSWTVARFTRASLSSSLRWADVLAVGVLAGIGFTVSLLIGELAFEGDPVRQTSAKVGVLLGSVLAAVLAAVALTRRRRAYAAIGDDADDDDDAGDATDAGADVDGPGPTGAA